MDYQILKNELDTDPLGRGYSGMTDGEASNSLSRVIDRPAEVDAEPGALFEYCGFQTAKDAPGENQTPIYGRLQRVRDLGALAIGTQVFDTDGSADGVTLTDRGLDCCQVLLAMCDQDRLATRSANFNDARFDQLLQICSTEAGVLDSGDVAALKALSDGLISRAAELDRADPPLDSGGRVKSSDVAYARSL